MALGRSLGEMDDVWKLEADGHGRPLHTYGHRLARHVYHSLRVSHLFPIVTKQRRSHPLLRNLDSLATYDE